MLIQAERRFAKRIAKWMGDSKLTADEMTERLSRYSDTFIKMVVEEHNKLVEKRKR